MNRTQVLADYYKSRPNEWISVYDLERVAGRFAWRTRSSECHTQLGMQIDEWCKRLPNGTKEPHRKYVPSRPVVAVQGGLFTEGLDTII